VRSIARTLLTAAGPRPSRRGVAAVILALLVLFGAIGGAGTAAARPSVRIIAPRAVLAPHAARISVRVPRTTRRVAFYLDGRRRWVAHHAWQTGHIGYLRTARMMTGRHSLQLRAMLGDGRVARAQRRLFVSRRSLSPKGGHAKEHEKTAIGEAEPVTETESASAPSPVSALLLDAGFENGLSNWNTAGVGEVVPSVVSDIVRSGSAAAKFELTGSQNRSELILGGDGTGAFNPVEFTEGSEYFYGFSFNIQSMVYGHPGAHNLIMQFKSDGTGSPNFGLQLWDYAGDNGTGGGRGLWSSGDAMGGDRFLAPVAERQWHDVVIHFRASSQESGFYELFVDGSLIDSRSGVSMIVPGHSYAYIKNGIYRNGGTIPGTSQLRVDAAKLGTSASAVLPG
jgi:hypothetical protein